MFQTCIEKKIQHLFDCFCKSVIKRTKANCYKLIKKRNDEEVSLSSLSEDELSKLVVNDIYFNYQYLFEVLGEQIQLTDNELGKALSSLSQKKRDIIFMKYFFDMKDDEIAEHLNMPRRTVSYQRTKTLHELKKHMESEE